MLDPKRLPLAGFPNKPPPVAAGEGAPNNDEPCDAADVDPNKPPPAGLGAAVVDPNENPVVDVAPVVDEDEGAGLLPKVNV